ncbi:hypothetical protein AAVH_43712 [Aphelenchoides avenae]|nr:hypothetical protein AAVH_43712 [Aphelenchus avenae]
MLGVCFQLPPPGPLLQALFGDVLDTRTGLDFGCGEVDPGRGELLSLPALKACTELYLSADSPVIDNVDDVENFVDWLHSPTDGLKVFAHTIVPLPTHPRRINNLKLADDMWDTFRERCFERFENADRLLIFTATVVFPAAAELPLFASQGFRNTDTNEMLSFRVSDSMPGLTEQHVLVRRVPLME